MVSMDNGIFRHEKGYPAIVTAWTDLQDIVPSEISPTEKGKYCMMKSRKKKSATHRNREKKWVPQAGKWEK